MHVFLAACRDVPTDGHGDAGRAPISGGAQAGIPVAAAHLAVARSTRDIDRTPAPRRAAIAITVMAFEQRTGGCTR